MTGWKSKTGGVGFIATGIGLIIAGLVATPVDGDKLASGVTALFAGFAALGIAHKVEKAANGK